MTVSTTINRVDYTGNGILTSYPYPFRIISDADLDVYVQSELLVLGINYTVTGVGAENGGNVVFVVAPTGPMSILREVSDTQTVDYVANDSFPAETHEAALDKLTMITQQTEERVDRTLTFAPFSMEKNKRLDDLIADKFLRVNSDASGISMSDVVDSGTIGIPVGISQGGSGETTATNAIGALTANGASLIISNGGPSTAPANTSENQIYSGTIKSGMLGQRGGFIVEFAATVTLSANLAINIYVGATLITAFSLTASDDGTHKFTLIVLCNSGTPHGIRASHVKNGSASVETAGTLFVDLSGDLTISVTVLKSAGGDAVDMIAGYARLL